MAQINRSDVIQKAVNDLNLQPGTDKIPTETLDKVQLVYSLNREKSNFILSGSSTSTGTITLTIPTLTDGQEFFLNSVSFAVAKDATCDNATGRLTINATGPFDIGVSKEIAGIATVTLTADSQSQTIVYTRPIKLKSASTVTFPGTFTAGAMSRWVQITGTITSSG